jgi:molybdopterin-guanine dinucleotide biosynthesis protein A
MGADKAFAMLNGRTLLERALDLARAVTVDVAIVGAASKFNQYAPVVEDVFPNCGPLAGIHAALQSSTTDLNLILAVDVPFITTELLGYLLSQATSDNKAMAVVPRTSRGWHPLCAVYRRQFAIPAEAALRAGSYKIDSLFTGIKMRAVDEAELAAHNFSSHLFSNLNTPEELTAAGGLPAIPAH